MYLTPKQKRKNTFTLVLLLLGIPLTVFAAWQTVQLLSRGAGDSTPSDVVISNVSTNSVTIGWVTDASADGAVVVVENGNDSSQVIDKRGDERRKNHYVELSDLEPNTTYSFAIVSGEERYDSEESTSFSFTTAPVSSEVPTPNTVYGDGGDFSQDNFIVYIINESQSSFPVSVVPNASGGWAADLSGFRNNEDMSLISVADSDELKIIVISGVNEGDVVSGTFSELFDSKGQLRSVYSLAPEENTELMQSFQKSTDVTDETDNTDDTDTTDETDNTDDTDDTTSTIDTTDDDEESRSFRIIHDIDWVDMISAEQSIDVNTGKDSVLITNLRDTGFDVIWLSKEAEKGYVLYGTSSADISYEAKDIRDSLTVKSKYNTHYVEIDDLDPETKYYFTVHSGDNAYTGYDVDTFSTLSSAPPIGSISGDIANVPSEEGAIVVGQIVDKDSEGTSGSSQYASVVSDSTGGWILSVADVRNSDGSAYYSYTDSDVIELSVICYAESSMQSESMKNIEDRDIELEVEKVSNTIDYTRVPLLDNYSVLGVQTYRFDEGTEDEVDNSENIQDVLGIESESVPNTGILDSVFGKIFVGLGCVVFGIGIWKSVNKKKNFTKMSL